MGGLAIASIVGVIIVLVIVAVVIVSVRRGKGDETAEVTETPGSVGPGPAGPVTSTEGVAESTTSTIDQVAAGDSAGPGIQEGMGGGGGGGVVASEDPMTGTDTRVPEAGPVTTDTITQSTTGDAGESNVIVPPSTEPPEQGAGLWGEWGPCSATCGSTGVQTRACSGGQCVGDFSQPCNRIACNSFEPTFEGPLSAWPADMGQVRGVPRGNVQDVTLDACRQQCVGNSNCDALQFVMGDKTTITPDGPVGASATGSCLMMSIGDGESNFPYSSPVTAYLRRNRPTRTIPLGPTGPMITPLPPTTPTIPIAPIIPKASEAFVDAGVIVPMDTTAVPPPVPPPSTTVSPAGTWSDWSACSASCGRGTQTRTCSGGTCVGGVMQACSANVPCNTYADYEGPYASWPTSMGVVKGSSRVLTSGIPLETCQQNCSGNTYCDSFMFQTGDRSVIGLDTPATSSGTCRQISIGDGTIVMAYPTGARAYVKRNRPTRTLPAISLPPVAPPITPIGTTGTTGPVIGDSTTQSVPTGTYNIYSDYDGPMKTWPTSTGGAISKIPSTLGGLTTRPFGECRTECNNRTTCKGFATVVPGMTATRNIYNTEVAPTTSTTCMLLQASPISTSTVNVDVNTGGGFYMRKIMQG
jgi:hypothetical protein